MSFSFHMGQKWQWVDRLNACNQERRACKAIRRLIAALQNKMNKVKRDYCTKGRHPKWRAWVAKYDMGMIHWKHLGNFCLFCGGLVSDPVPDAIPDRKKRNHLP